MAVTLRGNSDDLDVPAMIVRQRNTLDVAAEFSVSQTALGLSPFSVVLGALRVSDQLDIRIHLSVPNSQ